jgi:transposase-like protein
MITKSSVPTTKEGDTAMLSIVNAESDLGKDLIYNLDEIARQGAKRMLAEALQQEVSEYISGHRQERDEGGKALVVRNGKARTRKITCGAGTIDIAAPRVNDKREGYQFTSKILPPYMRKSANIETLIPILYLKGLSTSDFKSALTSILGEGVSGLSPASIVNLKRSWEDEFDQWKKRLITSKYVYLWADGVNVKVRLGEDKKLCLLVIVGVTLEGKKELITVEPGYRESEESWSIVLRDVRARGLHAPMLAVGDGALGFWNAVGNVFPETKEQRCWVHKIANVLDKLPKRLQGKAKELLHDMMYADTLTDAVERMKTFETAFELKHKAAVECLTKDWDELTTFFKFPAQHWAHLRTTNPIESTFATVKLRTKVTKGAGSPKAASSMAFKLMQEAEKRWNRIRGHEEIKNVISGVEYRDGIVITKHSHREAVNG